MIATAVGLVALNGNSAADDGKANGSVGIQMEVGTETHWSLKPITRPNIPPVPNHKWKPRNPIDNFILAKLAEAKLSPSAETDRRTLIRRVYFDLIGLPPSPEEVKAFQKDSATNAYEKVVEQLLASPDYGERWARHWLDVVRFAETHGFEMNQPRPNAWRYRDYVIDAFNNDKPYNRFMIEQIAGDLLGDDAATGFLVGGAWDQVKSPDPVLTAAQRADELHDMVSTTGSAFLGLTVGCARCHNHKFDPIPQTDYYAIKACLAGVQHGERKLRTPELVAREKELGLSREKLAQLDNKLAQFEAFAFTGRIVLVDTDSAATNAFGSRVSELVKPTAKGTYPAGTARGERDDPGDIQRLANFTSGSLAWSNFPNTNVFAYEPRVTGRFRVWLSWGCGSKTHARDATFMLDRDGDAATTGDQIEIAKVDQQRFADGTGDVPDKPLWSGFYDAGPWDLSDDSKIILRAGAADAFVTASVLALVEEQAVATGANKSEPSEGAHFLRSAVHPRLNVDRFAPTQAKRLRFTIARTTDAEPCIDELEVYTSEPNPRNIALASAGTKATASSVFPNSEIHRLEHINDGRVGNSRSWISDERGKGRVELEFAEEVSVSRVLWGRDRDQKYSDRLALDYRIEVAGGSNDWRVIASSQDRLPYVAGRSAAPNVTAKGLSTEAAREMREMLSERSRLEARIKELANVPMVYAGTFTNSPEPTHRLFRGDPMQQREEIEPAGLTAIPIKFHLESLGSSGSGREGRGVGAMASTPDQERRLTLANWMADPANPLPARVMVNRIWQHHFGEGIVSTPSDFGKKGAPPSHPELLDWLAAEFVSPKAASSGYAPPEAWSIKHIHRLIVTSATYRQSSTSRSDCVAVDASSRMLWRFPPQRLDAEPLRDTILAITGKLNPQQGGPGFSPFEPNDNYVRVYNPKKEFGPAEWRRMIYMTKVRMQQDETFGAFDCPDGGQIAPKRMRSTTPLQALNLLNSEFILQQAGFFAERLEREAGKSPKGQVRLAFELAYNRAPDSKEIAAALGFVEHHGLKLFCRAMFNSNEFIFVD